jgi:hypothetical protein
MRWQGDTAHLHGPSCVRRPGVDGGLQVHVLERGKLTRHHGMVQVIRSDEIAYQRRNLIVLPAGRMDPVQKTAERRCELAGLIVWCLIGHGLDLQLRWLPRAAGNTAEPIRRVPSQARTQMDTTEDKSSSPNEKTLPYESTAQGVRDPMGPPHPARPGGDAAAAAAVTPKGEVLSGPNGPICARLAGPQRPGGGVPAVESAGTSNADPRTSG